MAERSRFSRASLLIIAMKLAEPCLPRLPDATVEPLVGLVGRLAWLVNRSGRRAVKANLHAILRREPVVDEVQTVFRTAVANYVDLFRLSHLVEANVAERVQVEGWEHLSAALTEGRGALVASLHLGNIEAIGYGSRVRGVNVMIPVERLDPPEFLERMIALRERAGLRCVPVGRNAFASIREALARNAVVGIGADRITLGSGEIVRFCGRPARMPIAAAALARRTGAPLLPIGNARLPDGRFRCVIGPPISVDGPDGRRLTLIELTERLLAALEPFLRDIPTQWVVFRQIWDDTEQ